MTLHNCSLKNFQILENNIMKCAWYLIDTSTAILKQDEKSQDQREVYIPPCF